MGRGGGGLRAAGPVKPGQPAPSAWALRAYCRERLAPYKTPQHWVFVDAFPMTPSGKIQKYKLRDSFAGDQPVGPARPPGDAIRPAPVIAIASTIRLAGMPPRS